MVDADGRLGLCDVLAGSPISGGPTWAQLAYNAGARYNRWEFRWDKLEPQPGVWDFSATDADVQSSQDVGLNVLGILIGTPKWGAAQGQPPGNGLPKGLNLDPSDPNNLWATYVRQTVTQYKGTVSAWEVWNEPDLHFFWNTGPDEYFRLLKVTYQVVKSVDPNAKVIMAGMVAPGFTFSTRVLDDANRDPGTAAAGGYFDAAAWHVYGPAHSAFDNVRAFIALLAAKGRPDAPVWVTEEGFPASNPSGESRQAAFVLQSTAFALAAGARHVLVYRASDDPGPKTWGLQSAPGGFRQGYLAFQVAARYLGHASSVSYSPTDSLERMVFYQPDRRVVLVWSKGTSNVPYTLDAAQPSAASIDWQGVTRQVYPTSGAYRLTALAAQYNLGSDNASSVVGGPPQLLVERIPAVDVRGISNFMLPIFGLKRQMLLFNPGQAELTVEVSALARPSERLLVAVPPGQIRRVDLDLLAGNLYHGLYVVSSTGPMVSMAGSDTTERSTISPSATWTIPTAPHAVTIGNVGANPRRVSLMAIGDHGKIRVHVSLQVAARRQTSWIMPQTLADQHLAISVLADGPVVVGGDASSSSPQQAQSTWYALRPTGRLTVFNPGPSTPALVEVRYTGSTTVQSEQVTILPRHSYALPYTRAGAAVITASAPISVGYKASVKPPVPPVSSLTGQTSLTALGSIRRIAVFNPGRTQVHIVVYSSTGTRLQQRGFVLSPGVTRVVGVRAPGDPAVAVTVKGDSPVVVAPSQ